MSVGFPETMPRHTKFKHGWFLETHERVFNQVIKPDTKVIVEIGSWYGASARWLAENSPEEAKIYAIDLWDDDFILNDDHYNGDKGHISKMLRAHPLYATFLVNVWDLKDKIIPMRMDSIKGLKYLKGLGIEPDIIYIDGDHHYEAAKRDISNALHIFPRAIIVGDDYGNYEDVRRAVHECAIDNLKQIHVDFNHCWTYAPINSRTGRTVVPEMKAMKPFADLLSAYTSRPSSKRSTTILTANSSDKVASVDTTKRVKTDCSTEEVDSQPKKTQKV